MVLLRLVVETVGCGLDSIKMNLQEVGWGSMDWIELTQDRDSGGRL
jgi:hypothetical protein